MPHVLTLLNWYAEKNAQYFNVIYLLYQDECLIFLRYLIGVPRRMPHILTLLICYAKKNASYFNVTYSVCTRKMPHILTLFLWCAEKNVLIF